MKIRIAGNTEGPCYFIIKSKGFKVEVVHHDEDEYTDYIAIKDDLRISATSMEELLGLITMYEQRTDKWMMTDEEYDFYSEMKYGNKTFE